MDSTLWDEMDAFIAETLLPADPALDAAIEANRAAGLPAIDVSPAQGKLLHLFARMIGARRVLEIGTLGGYSTICLARALPDDGLVVTLEADADHAAVARKNIDAAGQGTKVDIRVGPALHSLPGLEGEGAFDLVFIDADKANIPAYVDWALRLARVGSVIVVDNVVRKGAVLDPASENADAQGARRFFLEAGRQGRLCATAIQTVGVKGWDGFAIGIVEKPVTPRR
jgi:predicted O-methyltransferase YrrM